MNITLCRSVQRPTPPPPRGVWDKLLRDPPFFRLRRAKMILFLRIFDCFLPILGLDFIDSFSILTPLFLYQIISDYHIELTVVRSDLPNHRSDEEAHTGAYTVTRLQQCSRSRTFIFSTLSGEFDCLSHLKRSTDSDNFQAKQSRTIERSVLQH